MKKGTKIGIIITAVLLVAVVATVIILSVITTPKHLATICINIG